MRIRYDTALAGLLLAALAMFPAEAQQQQPTMQHGGMNMGMSMGTDMPMTGNQDVDFARMMIPHHRGAVDMARAQLEKGKDPQMRELAQKIIADQQREIAILEDWLAKQPK